MSFGELLFLAFLALMVFGPQKLPEIARTAAKLMAELRRAGNEFRYSLEEEMRTLEVHEAEAKRPALPPAPVAGAVATGRPTPVVAAAPEGEGTAANVPAAEADAGAAAALSEPQP